MIFLSIGAIILALVAMNRASRAEEKVADLATKLNAAAIALGLNTDEKQKKVYDSSIVNKESLDVISLENNTKNNPVYVKEIKEVNIEPYKESDFSIWLKDNWIMKLGVSLILIGFVWALNYAYQNGILGDAGISMLGMIFGASLMVFGFIRMRSFSTQGSIFMLLGTGLIMLTTYFVKSKEIISEPVILMFIMFMSLAITSAAAVIYNRKALNVVSLILALLVPALIVVPNTSYLATYLYLLIVTLGTIWVVILKDWKELTFISLLGVCAYSAYGIVSGFGNQENVALIFAFIFGIVFFATSTISLLQKDKNSEDNSITLNVFTAILNVAMISTFIISIISKEWHIILLTLISVLFSISSFLIYKITKQNLPFFVYSGVSIGLLAYVTFLIFEGNIQGMAIAYTVEITAFSLLTYFVTKNLKSAINITLLFIFLIWILISSISNILTDYNLTSDLVLDYVTVFAFMIITSCLAFYYKNEIKSDIDEDIKSVILMPFVYSGVLALSIIWGICHIVFGAAADTISLIVYALIGMILYVYGKNMEKEALKISGAILIGINTIWLIVILLDAEPIFRIIGFIVIGIILLLSAFILKNKN